MLLFADAGPGPLLIPMGSSVVLAGLFLAMAIVSGGLWMVRRRQNRPVFASRKFFALTLGAACLSGVVESAVIGLFVPVVLFIAALMIAAGVILVINGVRMRRMP